MTDTIKFEEEITLAHDKIHQNLKSFMLSCALNGAFEDDYEKEKEIYRMNLYIHEDGTECYTNYSNIFIGLKHPLLTEGSLDEKFRTAQTIIGHEVAHIRFTDKRTWNNFVNTSFQKYRSLSRFATDLLNILEDRRIEYYMGMASSYLQKRFFVMGLKMVDDIEKNLKEMANSGYLTSKDKLVMIQNGILYMSFMRIWPTVHNDEVLEYLKKCYPFVVYARKGKHTRNAAIATENVLRILSPLIAEYNKEFENEKMEGTYKNKGETGTNSPIEKDDLESYEAENAANSWSPVPSVEKELDEMAEKMEEMEEQEILSAGSTLRDWAENIASNLDRDSLKEKMEQLKDVYIGQMEQPISITQQIVHDFLNLSEKSAQQIAEEEKEELKIKKLEAGLQEGMHKGCVPRFTERSKMEQFSKWDYDDTVRELEPVIREITTSVQEIMQYKLEQFLYDQRSGRLDKRKLTSFMLFDNLDIFQQVDVEEKNLELEVMLLVDISGSNGCQVRNVKNNTHVYRYVANQMVAIILHEAMKRLKFKHSIWTFHSGGMNQYFSNIMDYSNCFDANIGTYLKEISAKGDNRDGYAIRYAGKYLTDQSNDPKRLLLVLSDGQPASSGYYGDKAMRDVRQAVEEVEEMGSRVIGMFSGNESENRYFKNDENPDAGMYKNAIFVNNDNIFDLPEKLKTLLIEEFEEHLEELLQ